MAQLRKHSAGHPVTFKNPSTRQPVIGHILDEVWADDPESFGLVAPASDGWRQAAFVAQLVRWPGNRDRVRFTYYLRPEGGGPNSWYFGGQYAPSMSIAQYRTLIKSLNDRHW